MIAVSLLVLLKIKKAVKLLVGYGEMIVVQLEATYDQEILVREKKLQPLCHRDNISQIPQD